MIAPKVGTPANRLLLIASRGPVDLDTLAARLHPPSRLASVAGMVARPRDGAATVAEVVGTSGHAWEVYARACEAEVFVSPRVVRVSPSGMLLLKKEGTP
jgi:hypothetical protein